MCCEKCTSDGIATFIGLKIFNECSSDEEAIIKCGEKCPKMYGPPHRYGKNRVLWGICKAVNGRRVVECCRHCDNFS